MTYYGVKELTTPDGESTELGLKYNRESSLLQGVHDLYHELGSLDKVAEATGKSVPDCMDLLHLFRKRHPERACKFYIVHR